MSDLPTPQGHQLKHILEAALLAADEPLTQARLAALFPEDAQPSNQEIGRALEQLSADCEDRGVELQEVASGFRLQVRTALQPWVSRLWTEKPQKYSRAMLETLSLIAYRQPITRGEIESVRGVSLSSNIIRSLQEREWVRIVGHRDVPGKPALFGTTRVFLDYFNLSSLDELPTLAEIKDMESLEPELSFEGDTGDQGTPQEDNDAGSHDEDDSGQEGLHQTDDLEDDELEDDDLDQAFADLDQAFGDADSIDIDDDAEEDETDDHGDDEGDDPEEGHDEIDDPEDDEEPDRTSH